VHLKYGLIRRWSLVGRAIYEGSTVLACGNVIGQQGPSSHDFSILNELIKIMDLGTLFMKIV
jgi:hypothetical protein